MMMMMMMKKTEVFYKVPCSRATLATRPPMRMQLQGWSSHRIRSEQWEKPLPKRRLESRAYEQGCLLFSIYRA